MKKNVFFRAGLILLCFITAFAGLPVCAEAEQGAEMQYYTLQPQDINYNIFYNSSTKRDELEIASFYINSGSQGNYADIGIIIPDKLEISTWKDYKETTTAYPITRLGRNSFRHIADYGEIVIPSSVTYIDSRAFSNGNIRSYRVDPDNSGYRSINGVIFSKDGKTLLMYPAGAEAAIYSAPDSTEKIGKYAFNSVYYLKQINLPDSVTEIGEAAFENCSMLGGVNIPDSVTSIGSGAFSGCDNLKSIYIPALENISRTDIFDNYNVSVFTPEGSSLLDDANNVSVMNNRVKSLSVSSSKKKFIKKEAGQYYLNTLFITLYFADGTNEYFSDSWSLYQKYGFNVYEISDQNNAPWDIGTHYFYASAFGLTCAIPVEIIEDPFESMEILPVEVTYRTGGDYNGSFYRYNVKDVVKVKVKYKNGNEAEISLREYAEGCGYDYYNYGDVAVTNEYDMGNWTAGNTYTVELKIGNDFYQVSVKVLKSPYDTLRATLFNPKAEYMCGEIPELEKATIVMSAGDGKTEPKTYTVNYVDYASGILNCYDESKEYKEFRFEISENTVKIFEYEGAPETSITYKVKTDADGNEAYVTGAVLKRQPDDTFGNGAVISVTYSDGSQKDIEISALSYNDTIPYRDSVTGVMSLYTNGFFSFDNVVFRLEIIRIYENSIVSELKIIFCGQEILADESLLRETDLRGLSAGLVYNLKMYGTEFNGKITRNNIDPIIYLLYGQKRFCYNSIGELEIAVSLDELNKALSDIFAVNLSEGDASLSSCYNRDDKMLYVFSGGLGDDFVEKYCELNNRGNGNASYEFVFGRSDNAESREAVSVSLTNGKIASVSEFVTCGDANADGTVDIRDLVRIKKITANIASAEYAELAADVNGDYKVNAEDLAALRRRLIL